MAVRHVSIPDDGVFEGFGVLYTDAAPMPPPRPSPPRDTSLGSAAHAPIDIAAALQQLRRALDVNPPLELRRPAPVVLPPIPPLAAAVVNVQTEEGEKREAVAVLPMPWPLSPAARVELTELSAHCDKLRAWLMSRESQPERNADRALVKLARRLHRPTGIRALTASAEEIAREMESWPAVLTTVRRFAPDFDTVDGAVRLYRFAADVERITSAVTQLSTLLRRYALLAPVIEAAAMRNVAAAEVRRWAAPETAQPLQGLREAVKNCNSRVARDRTRLEENVAALLNRIAAVQRRRNESA